MEKISEYLWNLESNIIDDVIEAQRSTAKKVCDDAQSLAPGSGKYSNSIKVSPTTVSGNTVKTMVYTDMVVGPAKSTGNSYNLGLLLETGTNPHAIPNAFDWGNIYGYDSAMYKRTLSKDWHPGFVSMPHFIPALNKNKKYYSDEISRVLKKRGVK